MYMGNIGTVFRAGFRVFQADVVYQDPSSPTGYSQFLINGERVKADLSGFYATLGVVFRF